MPKHEPLPKATQTRVADAGDAVRQAQRQLARARDRLDSAIYAAVVKQGCQAAAVADAAGVSRETVYKATGRHA